MPVYTNKVYTTLIMGKVYVVHKKAFSINHLSDILMSYVCVHNLCLHGKNCTITKLSICSFNNKHDYHMVSSLINPYHLIKPFLQSLIFLGTILLLYLLWHFFDGLKWPKLDLWENSLLPSDTFLNAVYYFRSGSIFEPVYYFWK